MNFLGLRLFSATMEILIPTASVLCMILMLIGEIIPQPPERLRGYFRWSLPERIETFKIYEESSRKALGDLNDYSSEMNITIPLFTDRTTNSSNVTLGSTPSLCVGILTSRRLNSNKSYLVQLVGSLVARMDIPPQEDVYMHVFNVDTEPEKHTEVEWISNFLPVTNLKARHKLANGFNLTVKQQEALDYASAFRIFGKMGCKNSLMLEDDAFASENWMDQVRDALNQLSQQPDWFLVRMYATRNFARVPRGAQKLYTYDQGYGTVAVLLNGNYVDVFATALESHVIDSLNGKVEFLPKDAYMSVHSRENKMPLQTFEPVVFQHTGIHSTVNNDRHLSTSVPLYMSARNFKSEGKPVIFHPHVSAHTPP
jgi:hypothetical protein